MLKCLWKNRSKHPVDWIGHLIFVGFLPTLIFSLLSMKYGCNNDNGMVLGMIIGICFSIGVEAVQAESQKNIWQYLKSSWLDILGDLLADGIGIFLAIKLLKYLFYISR